MTYFHTNAYIPVCICRLWGKYCQKSYSQSANISSLIRGIDILFLPLAEKSREEQDDKMGWYPQARNREVDRKQLGIRTFLLIQHKGSPVRIQFMMIMWCTVLWEKIGGLGHVQFSTMLVPSFATTKPLKYMLGLHFLSCMFSPKPLLNLNFHNCN